METISTVIGWGDLVRGRKVYQENFKFLDETNVFISTFGNKPNLIQSTR